MSIASASTTVKFHEFPSGSVVHNYQPGSRIGGPIRSISWSKNGNWLALVPHSGLVEIVSVKDQLKLVHTIHGIEEPSCATFQYTTKRNVAVGTIDGQVLVYDIKSRNVKKRFNTTTSAVTNVEFAGKDNHIVAGCGDTGDVFVYSNVTNILSGSFKVPRSCSLTALRTSPLKKNYVVAGSNEGIVTVWDINSNKNKYFVGSHKAPVTAVAFSPINSEAVVSAGLDRQFCCYDISGGKCIENIFVEHNMTSVEFSPDGKFIVMGSQKGKVYIYDSRNLRRPMETFVAHSGAIQHLSFRKDEDFEGKSVSNSSIFESPLNINNKDLAGASAVTPDSILRNNDTFDFDAAYPTDQEDNSKLSASEDSFMVAMGLGKTDTTESINYICESLTTSTANNKKPIGKFTPTRQSKLMHHDTRVQCSASGNKAITSTPNYLSVDTPISPFVNVTNNNLNHAEPSSVNNNLTQLGLENFIKNAVKTELRSLSQELKGVSEELKGEMKYYSTQTIYETRQMFLDMLMSMVKESIKVENNLNSLRSELAAELARDQEEPCGILEENQRLRQKIAVLEEKLAAMDNNRQ